jgi:tetratricopeptide (TPR) repeat protein
LTRAIARHERAIALREATRLRAAELACRQALALYVDAEGPRHPDVANALVELGQILEARDELRGARASHRRAVAILARASKAALADLDIARLALRARILLAGVERALGAYPAADRLFAAALRDARRTFGPRDPDVAGILNNLGVLRKAQGRYAEAARFYRRALPILEGWGDKGALATLYHNLGGIEHARGRYAAGEPHARRSVELRRAAHGAGHLGVAADVAALAAIIDARGRLDEAADLYGQALAVFRRKLGAQSSEVGLNLSNLASLRQRQGRYAAAERLYRRALAIQQRVFGRAHAEVAMTLNNMAYLVRETGDLARAERLYRRALDTFERAVGARHPHTRLCRGNYRAVVAERAKRRRSALKGDPRRRR